MRRRRLLLGAAAASSAPLLTGCDDGDPAATAAWRGPTQPAAADPRLAILAWAILAPSPANTQPWRVRLTGPDRMVLGSDPARRLPVQDPDRRQERLALGCFVELAALAARAYGRQLEIGGGEELELVLRSEPGARPDPLFAAVRGRRTSRRAFDLEKPVTLADAEVLAEAAGGSVQVGFVTAADAVGRLRDLAAATHAQAAALPSVAAERARWLRLGPDEAAAHGDGIVIGGRATALAHRAGLVSAEQVTARSGIAARIDRLFWDNLFAGTASFGWLATDGDDPEARLAAGRAYQRVDLAAAARGVAIHPVSEALGDVPELAGRRAELERQLGVASPSRVQMLYRLGYAGPQSPSPRRGEPILY